MRATDIACPLLLLPPLLLRCCATVLYNATQKHGCNDNPHFGTEYTHIGTLSSKQLHRGMRILGIDLTEYQSRLIVEALADEWPHDPPVQMRLDSFMSELSGGRLQRIQSRIQSACALSATQRHGDSQGWRKLFRSYDVDSSNTLDFREFVKAVRRGAKVGRDKVSDAELQEAFVEIVHNQPKDMPNTVDTLITGYISPRGNTPGAHPMVRGQIGLDGFVSLVVDDRTTSQDEQLAQRLSQARQRHQTVVGAALRKIIFRADRANFREEKSLLRLFHRYDKPVKSTAYSRHDRASETVTNGGLTRDGFEAAMKQLGVMLSEHEYHAIFAELDVNNTAILPFKQLALRSVCSFGHGQCQPRLSSSIVANSCPVIVAAFGRRDKTTLF